MSQTVDIPPGSDPLAEVENTLGEDNLGPNEDINALTELFPKTKNEVTWKYEKDFERDLASKLK